MEVEILARIQFAFTISFHYIYPPLSIGLGLLMVIFEGLYLKTKNKEYETLARFWTKIFALTFGIGVARSRESRPKLIVVRANQWILFLI